MPAAWWFAGLALVFLGVRLATVLALEDGTDLRSVELPFNAAQPPAAAALSALLHFVLKLHKYLTERKKATDRSPDRGFRAMWDGALYSMCCYCNLYTSGGGAAAASELVSGGTRG